MQARLHHARVVQHQNVVRADEAHDVGKPKVLHRTAPAIEVQQPARRAFGRGMLGDEVGREEVVEIG
jgi:hypothetical protein